MKKLAALLLFVLSLRPGAQAADTQETAPQPHKLSAELATGPVMRAMEQVADWQLVQPPKHRTDDWTYGALYAGVMALERVSRDPKYLEAMIAMGRSQEWKPGSRTYDADDVCVCQTYLELYQERHDPAMVGPTKERLDYILANPKTNDLHFNGKEKVRWSWCDALFMGPPAWIRLYTATDDKRYLDFMDREWWATSDFLYDKTEHLYYRDSTYFEKREANGQKVFWSRGNGWVLAGLARVLPFLPPQHPHRNLYEQQFKDMAARIAALQPSDGLWRPSLLDAPAYPLKETSGSGFYTFALAWGINNGLLDRATYEPTVRRAWQALVGCVTPGGKLEHVQPIGADPKAFDPTWSDVYGVGAFLLAGSEMHRLVAAQATK